MKIFEFCSSKEQKSLIEKIRDCDWKAAKFLADLLEKNILYETLGEGKLLLLTDGKKLVSFCTLTKKDCIDDNGLFPWIGFVFTVPEYRGNRYSGNLIAFACEEAIKLGYDKVYIATDHVGLYEKYGFEYTESRIDIYGEESRIYCRTLS